MPIIKVNYEAVGGAAQSLRTARDQLQRNREDFTRETNTMTGLMAGEEQQAFLVKKAAVERDFDNYVQTFDRVQRQVDEVVVRTRETDHRQSLKWGG